MSSIQSRLVRLSTVQICATLLVIFASANVEATVKVLPIQTEIQEQQNWCWAAVSLATMNYYNIYPGVTPNSAPHNNGIGQCVIATEVISESLGYRDCCDPDLASSPSCDKQWGPTGALALWGFAVDPLGRAATPEEIWSEIENDRPIYAVRESLGLRHFVLIIGMDNVSNDLTIMDPQLGTHVQHYDDFIEGEYHQIVDSVYIDSPQHPRCINPGDLPNTVPYNVYLRYSISDMINRNIRTRCSIIAGPEYVVHHPFSDNFVFEASRTIKLKPGFRTERLSYFHARIVD